MNRFLLLGQKALTQLKVFPGNRPDFFIIGVQKAGTSTLHHMLCQHPNLTGSSPKETHYFDKYIHQGRSFDWYKRHFVKYSFRQQLFFESTPRYISFNGVAAQLAENFPDTKLIAILRDPVSRAFSAWNMYRDMFEKRRKDVFVEILYNGEKNPLYAYYVHDRTSFLSFLEAVELEIEMLKRGETFVPGIVQRGLYAQQLSEYFEHFDRKQVLVIGFKDLANQPQEVVDKVCDFLNVSRLSLQSIVSEKRNARKYMDKMDDTSYQKLKDFYEQPNIDLERLLGSLPNW